MARFWRKHSAGTYLGEFQRRVAEAAEQTHVMLNANFADATDRNDALGMLVIIRVHP